MRIVRDTVLIIVITLLASTASAEIDAEALLKASDQARGGGLPGIVWEIQLQSREGDRLLEPQRIEVRATIEASVAKTLEPARFRGSRLLQVGNNMWLTRPGLSKPIPVSPRQRMSGQAANGDIAATRYASDYQAVLKGQEVLNGEPCSILELTAKNKRTTYDRIIYWIANERRVGVKAEFYSLSGKLLKTATFDYDQEIQYDGKTFPFVTRMDIRDALTDAATVMEYGAVEVRPVPASEFDLGQLH
jgi:hypothetical protein